MAGRASGELQLRRDEQLVIREAKRVSREGVYLSGSRDHSSAPAMLAIGIFVNGE